MSEDRRAFSGRRTADPEVARRLGLGVGDDVVVMLFHGEQHVGFVNAQGYAVLVGAGVAESLETPTAHTGPAYSPQYLRSVEQRVAEQFAFDELSEHEQE